MFFVELYEGRPGPILDEDGRETNHLGTTEALRTFEEAAELRAELARDFRERGEDAYAVIRGHEG